MNADAQEPIPTSNETTPPFKEVFLKWDTMWCEEHLKPYKTKGPLAEQASMLLAQELMCDSKFHGLCFGNTDNFDAVAAQHFKPVCCYLGKVVVRYIYAQTGVL